MTTVLIFVLGLFVTVIVATGAFMIGLQEDADRIRRRAQDLADVEKQIVGGDSSS
ncbi:MAG: hypothetical protein ABI557_16755 [Aureliella sp.]